MISTTPSDDPRWPPVVGDRGDDRLADLAASCASWISSRPRRSAGPWSVGRMGTRRCSCGCATSVKPVPVRGAEFPGHGGRRRQARPWRPPGGSRRGAADRSAGPAAIELLDPELGLGQQPLAALLERDAALVQGDRPLQGLAARLELGDRPLELGERRRRRSARRSRRRSAAASSGQSSSPVPSSSRSIEPSRAAARSAYRATPPPAINAPDDREDDERRDRARSRRSRLAGGRQSPRATRTSRRVVGRGLAPARGRSTRRRARRTIA